MAAATGLSATPASKKVETLPEGSNALMKPNSAEAIELGKTRLHDPWSALSLTGLLDGGAKQSQLFMADWKARGWIETCGFQQYRKTAKFGKTK